MTIKEKIIKYLSDHPEGIDDDKLANELNLGRRQQANSICRQLVNEGLLERKLLNGKLHNFLNFNENKISVNLSKVEENKSEGNSRIIWFWEGNVQLKVQNFLIENNYYIKYISNTAYRQKGIDIIAEKNGKELWITAKGYPEDKKKTPPATQAAHWFKDAVYDIIEYRGRNFDVSLGIALPDFQKYHTLSEDIKWFKNITGFKYFWVTENGEIRIE